MHDNIRKSDTLYNTITATCTLTATLRCPLSRVRIRLSLAKDLEYLAGAIQASIVFGAKVPLMLTAPDPPSTGDEP
jgi:hypothetical protein